MINVTCTTELNRQKAIAASARTALSATDNNSTTSDNRPWLSNLPNCTVRPNRALHKVSGDAHRPHPGPLELTEGVGRRTRSYAHGQAINHVEALHHRAEYVARFGARAWYKERERERGRDE